ncbi:MAG: hypothetical protein ACREP6_10030, partial [Candidatus Binataceae bacterium]
YALGREEISRVRSLGIRFYEVFRERMSRYGVVVGIGVQAVGIQAVEAVMADFEHGLGVPMRMERAVNVLILDGPAKVAVLRRIFGDTHQWSAEESLTDLEMRTLGRSLAQAAEEAIITAFGDILGPRIATMPVFINELDARSPVLGEERMLTIRAAVETGGPVGTIILLMPLNPLIQARARLRKGYLAQVGEMAKLPAENIPLGDVVLEVRAVLASFRTDARTVNRTLPGEKLFLGLRAGKLAPNGAPVVRAQLYAGEQPIGGGVVVEERGWRRILLDQDHG